MIWLAGLSLQGGYALAALGSTVLFWASGVQDPSMSGLLILSLIALLGVTTFEHAVAGFGAESYTTRDYVRSVIPMSILLVLLAWAAALFYWPLLGYRP